MNEITLWRRYEIEAAHQLSAGVPEGHQCRRLHGHRYVIHVGVRGLVGAETGMIIEYGDLDVVVDLLLRNIDHYSLNTLSERHGTALALAVSENPTVELLCLWLADALVAPLRGAAFSVAGVRVEEDSRASVEWRP